MSEPDLIVAFLSAVSPISEEAKLEIKNALIRKEASKGEELLKAGEQCNHIYFLISGFAHQFRYVDGKKDITYFWAENDLVTHMVSFLSRKPSTEYISILEDSLLYSLSYHKLQHLYATYPEFNAIGRLFVEKYFLDLAIATDFWRITPVKARYEKLIQEKPQLLKRANLGQIASYLNISQETLSRIRAEK